jgi:coiled-coil domain-containing protein 12
MASTQALGAAALDRKARLAQLKSLKRKQPDTPDERQDDEHTAPAPKSPRKDSTAEYADVTTKYLSGRNYDAETRGAKLGFENAPTSTTTTLEHRAESLATQTKRQADEEAATEAPLDLFKLQPKKPNWDLKRDLDRKLDVLNVRTDNAIARLVRERISAQQQAARAKLSANNTNGEVGGGDSEDVVGIEGTTLVEAVNIREREEEEDLRRERAEDEALLDGS